MHYLIITHNMINLTTLTQEQRLELSQILKEFGKNETDLSNLYNFSIPALLKLDSFSMFKLPDLHIAIGEVYIDICYLYLDLSSDFDFKRFSEYLKENELNSLADSIDFFSSSYETVVEFLPDYDAIKLAKLFMYFYQEGYIIIAKQISRYLYKSF